MNKDALVGWEPQGFGGEDVLSFAWSALMESQFHFFLIATREKMPGEKLQASKMSNVQLQTVLNQQSLRRDDGFSPSKVQECNGELPIEHASAKFQPLRTPKTNDQCYFPILNGSFECMNVSRFLDKPIYHSKAAWIPILIWYDLINSVNSHFVVN